MKILHIAPHFGGGTKTVLLNWIKADDKNEHTFVSLGYADDEVIQVCYENKVVLYSGFENKDYTMILDQIEYNDIVLIHYWNFPLLLHFLINTKVPPCRVIMWFHNSGFHAPYELPEYIIEYANRFVFTSSISYNVDTVKYLLPKFEKQLRCIWSTGGIERYSHVNKKEHEGFNLLYVGTVDYSKLHKNFVLICKRIIQEIPDSKITICGSGSDFNDIFIGLTSERGEGRVIMTGFVSDLTEYLETADIFLYPLNSKHFGTCEQVLGESMSCGIPPVVFNNDCEMEIVKHYRNGLVAPIDDIDKYIDQIKLLYEDIELRTSLSNYSVIDATAKYSLSNMIYEWNNLFKEVIQKVEKKEKVFDMDRVYLPQYTKNVGEGLESFLSALDFHTAEIFSNYIDIKRDIQNLFKSNKQWYSKAKGSINQYLEYFPDDKYLKEFEKMLIEPEEENKKDKKFYE